MLEIKNYRRAASLEEAFELNQKKANRVIGGMLWLKMSRGRCATAIDISGLGLNNIEEDEKEFRIGCMATLRQLELHPGLNAFSCGAVRDALSPIVGVQFRNLATVGGSVWGRFGFSDVLTVLTALGASVELYKKGMIPIEEFARMPYDRDILVRVIVPKSMQAAGFAALSVRNSRTDFPVLTVAAGYAEPEAAENGTAENMTNRNLHTSVRVAVGARPQKAMLLQDPEGFLLDGITEESAGAYAAWAAEQVPTGSNLRGSAAYRKHLTEVLVRRALLAASAKAEEKAAAHESDKAEEKAAGKAGEKTEVKAAGRAEAGAASAQVLQNSTAAPLTLSFELNGRPVRREIAPDLLLIDLVRAEGALSVKRGCETSNCGLCTVLLDGTPVLSCSLLAARAEGRSVTTLEGLQSEAAELGAFIADQGAEQCGFCNPGFMMNTIALLRENPAPSDEEIKAYLAGNLCRCSGYEGQLRGIRDFLTWRNEKKAAGTEKQDSAKAASGTGPAAENNGKGGAR